jgi:hypothetical protein
VLEEQGLLRQVDQNEIDAASVAKPKTELQQHAVSNTKEITTLTLEIDRNNKERKTATTSSERGCATSFMVKSISNRTK